MANIGHIEALTPKIDSSMNVLDIGPADGDIGYLFESLGCAVDFLDNAGTNYNDCRGIKCLKTELKSPANILEKDVDWQFVLQRQYDLAIALGIFYHLRNPMSFLMRLALHSQYLLLSTRVCQMDAVGNRIADQPLVYFLDTRESNDDPTNYWIFTQVSLKRVLKRSGWNMVNSVSIGETRNSDPIKRDERMFVYCQRVPNWVDLTKHHDF
ncbi:MAG: methyltransferase domain-containing protein [Nitrosotalea sp.]